MASGPATDSSARNGGMATLPSDGAITVRTSKRRYCAGLVSSIEAAYYPREKGGLFTVTAILDAARKESVNRTATSFQP